jgi:hypothetical protein
MGHHTTAKVLGVLGPLIAAIGAALLTYDALRGPVRWYDQVFFHRGALRAEARIHESVLKGLSSLPSPPYSDDQKRQLIDAEIEKYKSSVVKHEDETSQKDLDERVRSQKLAFCGFGLVAIGSLLQAAAIIVG